tara:strand:- start:2754 stop:2972 length:219 start_codon:yes stop_codon:yes gene_type:complete
LLIDFFDYNNIQRQFLNVKLIQWHKAFVERAQKEMGISNYVLYWFGFLEGALVMWVFLKVISVLKIGSELPF